MTESVTISKKLLELVAVRVGSTGVLGEHWRLCRLCGAYNDTYSVRGAKHGGIAPPVKHKKRCPLHPGKQDALILSAKHVFAQMEDIAKSDGPPLIQSWGRVDRLGKQLKALDSKVI